MTAKPAQILAAVKQDGASAHTTSETLEYLREYFGDYSIVHKSFQANSELINLLN